MSADHAFSGSDLTRRGMMRGVAVGGLALPLLAACGNDGAATPKGGESSSAPSVTVAAADVPVGGGKIFPDELVVVTQPVKGEFKAFTATCTHQGCPVTSISGGDIICPCHASHYSIEDGSVVSGPAPKPLAEFPVSLEGDQVVVG
jgi:Rieske Fe-S protein